MSQVSISVIFSNVIIYIFNFERRTVEIDARIKVHNFYVDILSITPTPSLPQRIFWKSRDFKWSNLTSLIHLKVFITYFLTLSFGFSNVVSRKRCLKSLPSTWSWTSSFCTCSKRINKVWRRIISNKNDGLKFWIVYKYTFFQSKVSSVALFIYSK